MKMLAEILKNIDYTVIRGDINILVSKICFDSRKVAQGDLFIAVNGTQTDGHKYIETAIAQGAGSILFETDPGQLKDGIVYIKTPDSAKALAITASNYFGNPTNRLFLIGVTGTNGKTTIATLLYHLFTELGYPSGLISTIRVQVENDSYAATHTTPDPIQLNNYFSMMVDKGCTHCFMEVSSHAISQKRIEGLKFCGGIFTNITRDHLDYHLTFDNYLKAKKGFFDLLPADAFAIMNADDKHSDFLCQNSAARVKTYALKNFADFKTKVLESDISGMHLQINHTDFFTNKAGTFNAYNLTAVFAAAYLLGIPKDEILKKLSQAAAVEGRFDLVRGKKGITAVVDYAHTPDALENILKAIDEVNKGKGRIITVFGCGGNRDRGKRPIMGKIATDYSDTVIITSDNPRYEEPLEIIREIEAGIPANKLEITISIQDREQAIKTACVMANENDIILVAGKGHETYQEINGVKLDFNDKEKLEHYLKF
jgi:UDP-N-acetylmuramoyl-L-alanyl-D-glutamate--2,6-diaminopimelate ligase